MPICIACRLPVVYILDLEAKALPPILVGISACEAVDRRNRMCHSRCDWEPPIPRGRLPYTESHSIGGVEGPVSLVQIHGATALAYTTDCSSLAPTRTGRQACDVSNLHAIRSDR